MLLVPDNTKYLVKFDYSNNQQFIVSSTYESTEELAKLLRKMKQEGRAGIQVWKITEYKPSFKKLTIKKFINEMSYFTDLHITLQSIYSK